MPLSIAIVGAGPSGFYCVDALLRLDIDCHIYMFEKLPTPYGLLRGGVAPDHLKMKQLDAYFERIALKSDQFHYMGNCNIGVDIHIEQLNQIFDTVIIATGAINSKSLGIPGEPLPTSYKAANFVGWYNGHPDFMKKSFDLSGPSVAIIGLGNVAIDIARILAKTPDELAHTDCPSSILKKLKESKVQHIHLIGRRGPAQAKFTPNELGEFGDLSEAHVDIKKDDLTLSKPVMDYLSSTSAAKNRKNIDILQSFLTNLPISATSKKSRKKIQLHFHRTPLAFMSDENGQLTGIKCRKNIMVGPPDNQTIEPTEETTIIPAQSVFTSIGYKGSPIKGLPFTDKGIIPNEMGRVIDTPPHGDKTPQMYVSGWIKRGPTGVIGTNKQCAVETVQSIKEDIDRGIIKSKHNTQTAIEEQLSRILPKKAVSFSDWKQIDDEEKKLGLKRGKPREKFTTINGMLNVLKQQS